MKVIKFIRVLLEQILYQFSSEHSVIFLLVFYIYGNAKRFNNNNYRGGDVKMLLNSLRFIGLCCVVTQGIRFYLTRMSRKYAVKLVKVVHTDVH